MTIDDDTDQPEPQAGPEPEGAQSEERVGRGNPPKRTRFKKGQSGNPKGRPKGATGRKKIVERVLLEKHTVSDGKKEVEKTVLELVVHRVCHRSYEGDTRAFKAVQELEGWFAPQDAPSKRCGVLIVPEKLTEEEWDAKYAPKDPPVA